MVHSQVGGGGTLIFSYIHRRGSFWGVQNFEFQYFWGFSDSEYFLGYGDFVDIFGGSSQNWTIFRVHSMHFRVFSKGQGTDRGDIFWVAKISIL